MIRRSLPSVVLRPAATLLTAALAITSGCSDLAEGGGDQPVAARPAFITDGPARPPAPRPTGRLPADTSCINAGCHASFARSRFVHGLLQTGECSACHGKDRGDHVFPVRRPGNDGCLACHDAVLGQRSHRHAAADVLDCTACHDPHASDHASLLKAESVETLCAACHPTERFAHPHAPYESGECVACHEPHESDFAGLLRGGAGPDHCALCHEDVHDAIAGAARVHSPVTRGCAVCHEPHGSDHPFGLTRSIDETCFSCHMDLEQVVAGAEAPHGALSLGERCANCHDPHASDRRSLLKDRQDVLCLGCHDEPIVAFDGRTIPDMTPSIRQRKFMHGPVESGDCSACHNVHGASHSRLLRQKFAVDFYTSFDLDQYALCFECHEQDLVTEVSTTTLTDFRNGDLNLHYVHVHRDEKGRTCRACHEIHGSDLPAHLAESVPFGGSGWTLPIQFEKTDTGGSCAPGCHRPMGYSRVPGGLPPIEEPEAASTAKDGASAPARSEGEGP